MSSIYLTIKKRMRLEESVRNLPESLRTIVIPERECEENPQNNENSQSGEELDDSIQMVGYGVVAVQS